MKLNSKLLSLWLNKCHLSQLKSLSHYHFSIPFSSPTDSTVRASDFPRLFNCNIDQRMRSWKPRTERVKNFLGVCWTSWLCEKWLNSPDFLDSRDEFGWKTAIWVDMPSQALTKLLGKENYSHWRSRRSFKGKFPGWYEKNCGWFSIISDVMCYCVLCSRPLHTRKRFRARFFLLHPSSEPIQGYKVVFVKMWPGLVMWVVKILKKWRLKGGRNL